MPDPNLTYGASRPRAVAVGAVGNGYAVFVPPRRGMSHNRPTLQDVEHPRFAAPTLATERRSSVRAAAVVLEIDAEFRPSAQDFAVDSPHCGSVHNNKTIGLVTRERV